MRTADKTRGAIVIASALGLALAATGCANIGDRIGEFTSEKVSEKILEEATGGDVDINIDADSGEAAISIDTEDGSFALGAGTFTEGWPDGLAYPNDYQILSSIRSSTEEGMALTTTIGTDEEYDSLVAGLLAAYESDPRFTQREEPQKMKLGELQTTSVYYEGSEFDLMLMISQTAETEMPGSVTYIVSLPD